jgi:tRNA-uridine 2-sulfurtransferase
MPVVCASAPERVCSCRAVDRLHQGFVMSRVAVAMSGGVDSAVTASLLCEQGHDVVGLTLRFWSCEDAHGCGADDGARQARAVADELRIPHHVVDCREPFERLVLRPAWEEYARGRTPNPCVTCNAEIKLRLLLEHARRLGAERLATGHYANVRLDDAGRPMLLRGLDAQKDQSYFLFALDEPQLAAIVLPLGERTKEEVRDLARRRGLPNAERPDSQDACLTSGAEGFAEALRRRFDAPARPGAIVDERGQPLGQHGGVHRYTIGQRRGLGVALSQRAYVLRIDADRGEVVLGRDVRALDAAGLIAGGARWLAPPGERAEVQVRYRHAAAPARIAVAGSRVEVRFDRPQRAVTPGQAAVVYDGPRLLGGGWIDRAIPLEGTDDRHDEESDDRR